MYDENTKVRECSGCGRVADTEGGYCARCIRAEICCMTEQESVRRNCGCRGQAARALERLQER